MATVFIPALMSFSRKGESVTEMALAKHEAVVMWSDGSRSLEWARKNTSVHRMKKLEPREVKSRRACSRTDGTPSSFIRST